MWPLLTMPSLLWTLLKLSRHCEFLPVFGNINFELLKWIFYNINRTLLKMTNWSLSTWTSQCPQKLLFVWTLTSETDFLDNDCPFTCPRFIGLSKDTKYQTWFLPLIITQACVPVSLAVGVERDFRISFLIKNSNLYITMPHILETLAAAPCTHSPYLVTLSSTHRCSWLT